MRTRDRYGCMGMSSGHCMCTCSSTLLSPHAVNAVLAGLHPVTLRSYTRDSHSCAQGACVQAVGAGPLLAQQSIAGQHSRSPTAPTPSQLRMPAPLRMSHGHCTPTPLRVVVVYTHFGEVAAHDSNSDSDSDSAAAAQATHALVCHHTRASGCRCGGLHHGRHTGRQQHQVRPPS